MEKRLNLFTAIPEGYKAMSGLENYIRSSNIPPIQLELIKIRASQINGCGFCLDMHTKDALKLGETAQRIFVLNGWRETDLFSEEEEIILEMTEEITLINQKGLTSATYQKALQFFDEKYIAQIIMAIVTINGWNRIAISTHLEIPKQ
ncbi:MULTISPECIES: carboxymuconolactone decarboxylase family protein [Chitinophagaceae]